MEPAEGSPAATGVALSARAAAGVVSITDEMVPPAATEDAEQVANLMAA